MDIQSVRNRGRLGRPPKNAPKPEYEPRSLVQTQEADIIEEDDDMQEDLFQEDVSMPTADGGGSGYSTMERHNDLLRELTNFSPFIKEAVNGWLGLIWSEAEGKYVESVDVDPIMNLKGVMWCVSYIKNYARKNNIITNISEREYNFLVIDIIDVVWLNLGTRDDFGFRSNGDILRVCSEIQHICELILMGAGDGKYNQLLSTTTTRSENVNMSQQEGLSDRQNQPSKSFFAKARGFLVGNQS